MTASQPPESSHPRVPSSEETSCVARSSGPLGSRVITTRAVEPGQVLLVFEGTPCPEPGRHTLQIGESQHLAPPTPETSWAFINHSCAPNSRIDFSDGAGPPRLVARKPLLAGEEVTFNYLTTEWEMATPFPCACAAPSCVGLVQGARHLDDARLAALRHDFALHIQARLHSRVERLLDMGNGAAR